MRKTRPTPRDILASFAELVHAAVPFLRRTFGDEKTCPRSDWRFETKHGPLDVTYIESRPGVGRHVCGAFVAAQFETDEPFVFMRGYPNHPAVRALGISHTSLKWNFHTFSYGDEKQHRTKAGRLTAEYAMVNDFIARLSPLLLPIHDELPEHAVSV